MRSVGANKLIISVNTSAVPIRNSDADVQLLLGRLHYTMLDNMFMLYRPYGWRAGYQQQDNSKSDGQYLMKIFGGLVRVTSNR